VTLYDDAKEVARFVGVRAAKKTHVVVLDDEGQVSWFHADGYSDAAARDMLETVEKITGGN
jgi:predicted transcriptional regulator